MLQNGSKNNTNYNNDNDQTCTIDGNKHKRQYFHLPLISEIGVAISIFKRMTWLDKVHIYIQCVFLFIYICRTSTLNSIN